MRFAGVPLLLKSCQAASPRRTRLALGWPGNCICAGSLTNCSSHCGSCTDPSTAGWSGEGPSSKQLQLGLCRCHPQMKQAAQSRGGRNGLPQPPATPSTWKSLRRQSPAWMRTIRDDLSLDSAVPKTQTSLKHLPFSSSSLEHPYFPLDYAHLEALGLPGGHIPHPGMQGLVPVMVVTCV